VKIEHTYFKTLWLAGLAIVGAVAFVGCGKSATKPAVAKVWTSADCANHVPDSSSWSFDECDSVFYRDFLNDCQWDGDTIPSSINDFTNMGVQMRPGFWNLKKLSPKMVRMWWWVDVTFSGSMTELPPEIWALPNVYTITLNGMPNLTKIPDMTDTNEKLTYIGIANMPRLDSFPSGLWNAPNLKTLDAGYDGIQHLPTWLPRLQSLTNLRVVNSQLLDLPDNIGDVPSLIRFDFYNNQITTLSESLCSAHFTIDPRHNRICSLTDSVRQCLSWWDSLGYGNTQTCN